MRDKVSIIYLTEDCNLRCKYCYQGTEKIKSYMSKDVALKTVDKILEHEGKVNIQLFGGEPLLNWDVVMAIIEHVHQERLIRKKNVQVGITTNATLLTLEKIKTLFKYNNRIDLDISIDGNKKSHDSNRVFKDGTGSFDIAINNIKNTLAYFPLTYARVVINDLDQFENDIMFLKSIGFRKFKFQGLQMPEDRDSYYKRFYSIAQKLRDDLKDVPHIDIICLPMEKHLIKQLKSVPIFEHYLTDGTYSKEDIYVKKLKEEMNIV